MQPSGDLRLARRASLVLGPRTREGERSVHYVKDEQTGRFFRLGPRECFVLGLLDGERTLERISSLYEDEFKKTLDANAWTQLLELFRERGLLADGAPAAKRRARQRVHFDRESWALRIHLADPDRLLGWLEPRLRFLCRGWLVAAVLALAVVMEVWVLGHLAQLRQSLHDLSWSTGALVMTMAWLTLAAHELAHGLACKHFGGRARDLGIVFRFLMFFPYCRVDDMVLFERRRERVLTALAGPLVNLCVLIPFPILWSVAPSGSALRATSAAMLTLFNLASIVNLMPFLRMDGYLMLAHGLGMPRLQEDAIAALRGRLTRPGVKQRWGLAVYGALSLLVTAATVLCVARLWYAILAPR